MKINKIFLASILLLALLCVSAVSADENVTADDSTPSGEDVQIANSSEDTRQELDADISADFTVNESSDITISSPENLTGSFELYADGEFIKNESNGTRQFENVTFTVAGNHTLNLIHSGDENYLPLNKTFEIIVKDLSSVEIDDIADTPVTDNVTVTFSVTNPTEITAVIQNLEDNTTEEIANITNSTVSKKLKAGSYTITVFNAGSEYIKASNATKSFNVTKAESEVVIDDIADTYVWDNVTVTFNVTNPTNITVIITNLDDNTTSEITDFENFTFTKKLNAGSYAVTVSNEETDTVSASNATKEFSVIKAASKVSIDDIKTVYYMQNATVNFTVENETSISVTLTDRNNATFNVTVLNGTVMLENLETGDYVLNITNAETDNITGSSASAEFSVIKANSSVNITSEEFTYADSLTIELTSENATSLMYVLTDSNGTVIKNESVDANANITGIHLDAGEYLLSVTTVTDDIYENTTANFTVTVKKADVIFSVFTDSNEIPVNSNVRIPILVDTGDVTPEGTLTFKIGNITLEEVNVTDKINYFTYTPDKIGAVEIDIIFSSDNFNGANGTSKISVSGLDTELVIDCDSTLNLSKSAEISVTVNSTETLNGQNVTLYADGDEVASAVLVNGSCTFTYTPAETGSHTLKAVFAGDDTHEETETSKEITVVETSKITASPLKLAYGSKTVKITLTDQSGNAIAGASVTVVLNKKTYVLTTNSKGQVSVSTSGLAPKNYYTLTASFDGDGTHTKTTATAKVVITKATPKITAAKKTFKIKPKTKKYTITLKVNGNVMKKTKVYIKVNGKTYSAKTNSKGKATFKITNLNKRGKFIAAVTYKGSSKYAKVVTKTVITVKR